MGPYQQRLLEALADVPLRPHSSDDLIKAVWGDLWHGGPDDAANALRFLMWRLRHHLKAQRLPVRIVCSKPRGFGWQLEPTWDPERERAARKGRPSGAGFGRRGSLRPPSLGA